MRKVTGHIGAIIILFALMGSILAGYALNVSGQTVIVNDYEMVTDVSGLYGHTQERAYIDYNPASNYIGYKEEEIKYYSDATTRYYKVIDSGTITGDEYGNITVNNELQGNINPANVPAMRVAFICDKVAIEYSIDAVNNLYYVVGENLYYNTAPSFTININGNTTTLVMNNNTYVFTNVTKNISFWGDAETSDYYKVVGSLAGYNTPTYAYCSGPNDIYTLSRMTPAPDVETPATVITYGANYTSSNPAMSGQLYGSPPTTPNWGPFVDVSEITNGAFYVMVNYTTWPGVIQVGYDRNITMDLYCSFYPRSLTVGGYDIGINYTESNRVNNYPIETDYDSSTTTTTGSLDLMAMSAYNYLTNPAPLVGAETFYNWGLYQYLTYKLETNNMYSYRLSDVISTLTIPANTKMIKFDAPSSLTTDYYTWAGASNDFKVYYSVPASNWAVLVPYGDIAPGEIMDYSSLINRYIYYYTDTGMCELYTGEGVKLGTYSGPSELYVMFKTNIGNRDPVEIELKRQNSGPTTTYDDYITFDRPKPYLNLIYTTTGTITNVHYSDITKGYSIKSSNLNNVQWDNQYSNGDIKILFRADSALGEYSNNIIVGDNTISVQYNNNRYYVSLNGGESVNVGTWRNIILDIDLVNGRLTAVPVRTFNSFVSVVMDNTSVLIGDLINPTPTNIIEWAPTSNSLMFNIYQTSVFMDTYGVVMVNPMLNITDYFPDLNNFYRLVLNDFSIYGDSITVNGVTGTVTDNILAIDDYTLMLNKVAITYADGNAYIEDNNVKIDLGPIVDNTVSMAGTWYFNTNLLKGFTTQKQVYDWNWSDFILDNTQFCLIYAGLAIAGLIIARKYANLSTMDYIVLITSFIIALSMQVIA